MRPGNIPQSTIRACAWCCVALVGVLSWLPGSMQHRTGLGGHVEHLFAYFVTARALTLAYPRSRGLKLASLLAAYAALLELGQLYVPGRSAQIGDWLVSSAGAVLGVLALTYASRATSELDSVAEQSG